MSRSVSAEKQGYRIMTRHRQVVREEAKQYSDKFDCTCFVLQDTTGCYSVLAYDSERVENFIKQHGLIRKVSEIWDGGIRSKRHGWRVE